MDELIGRLIANVGIDQTTAQKSVGIILQFLLKEGPADKVQGLLAKLPGADALIQSAPPDEGGGIFGGGVLAAGTRMMATGLSMGQVQAVTRETIAFAVEERSAALVDALEHVANAPADNGHAGLRQ